ncbi:hypothetical protein [Acuticoccus mangrovi]|uniref:Glycosyl transferase family 28 C-terminal domain-containing protein n=1 Tax=Acuticoccus mangrovi TaxID=2796142 RepID=A0A934MHX5_9HYPH|nr:hypothetical protein [Acuticoccus mangrovi]MBJ3777355.1 hypothetical protein [Acuticoccus mangrovi]
MVHYTDLLFIADPRFPGGTSTALATEIAAARKLGIASALLPVKGPALVKGWPFHAEIRAALDAGETRLVEPGARIHARVAVIHHPSLFELLPCTPLRVEADVGVIVLHHPRFDAAGKVQYDLERVVANARTALGTELRLGPVGPLVRQQLPPDGVAGAPLLSRDWVNIIDVDDWPARGERPVAAPARIGRHSRPSLDKWPTTLETALLAYPDDPAFEVSMLGADRFLADRYGHVPLHWRLRPFEAGVVKDYLTSLDFYVYYHADDWIEAFGRSILEAATVGLVVILPPHFEALFGPAAIYREADAVATTIAHFAARPAEYAKQSARARAHVAKTFGPHTLRERLELLDPERITLSKAWPKPAFPLAAAPSPKRVVLMSSNGVGLGHLTRLLAVADRLPADVEPVFLTLSRAAGLVAQAGYMVEYRPFHRGLDCSITAWNANLAEDIVDVLSYYGAQAFVFDGNMPYAGVVEALETLSDRRSVWIRRGFWTDGHRSALAKAGAFDAVIEPGDIAGALDTGPTAGARAGVHLVNPIVRGDPDTCLPRAEARRQLGLAADGVHVLLSLGSRTNFEFGDAPGLLVDMLAAHDGVHIHDLRSPLATRVADERPDGDGARADGARADGAAGAVLPLERYPIFPFLHAFDFLVGTCGYNTFHECVLAGLPAIYVPNDAPEMDRQDLRARFGEIAGFARVVSTADPYVARQAVADLMDAPTRRAMARRAAAFASANGAAEVARFVSEYANLRKMGSRSEVVAARGGGGQAARQGTVGRPATKDGSAKTTVKGR